MKVQHHLDFGQVAVLGVQERSNGRLPAAVGLSACLAGSADRPAIGVAAAAEVTLLVIRPQVSELAHLKPRVKELDQAGLRLSLVLAPAARQGTGEPSYPAREITDTLGLPVRAAMPYDPRALSLLLMRGEGAQKVARRLPLLRAAVGLKQGGDSQ